MITVPPWLRVAVIFNLVMFTVFGAIVPYYLTGSGAIAVVRSQGSVRKGDSKSSFSTSDVIIDSFYRHCWFKKEAVDPKCRGTDTPLNHRPSLLKSRDVSCPFPGNVCIPSISPIQVEHRNLLPYDFGVNLEPDVTLSHRITCAPLQTELFIDPTKDCLRVNSSVIWFGKSLAASDCVWAGGEVHGWYRRLLHTQNGPNRFSSEWSGHYDEVGGKPFNLEFFPKGVMWPPPIFAGGYDGFHPSLERHDGQVVLFLLMAEYAGYSQKVNDPIYAAHGCGAGNGSRVEDPNYLLGYPLYFPDYEATALGCFEQFQTCLNKPTDKSCKKWGTGYHMNGSFWGRSPIQSYDEDQATRDSLRHHGGGINGFLPSRGFLLHPRYIDIDRNEQWVLQVQAFLEMNFLKSRARYFDVLSSTSQNYYSSSGNPKSKLLLFRDSDYTNIDVIGLILTFVVLRLLCSLSFVKRITQCYRLVRPKAKKTHSLFVEVVMGNAAILNPSYRAWVRTLRTWFRAVLDKFQTTNTGNSRSISLPRRGTYSS